MSKHQSRFQTILAGLLITATLLGTFQWTDWGIAQPAMAQGEDLAVISSPANNAELRGVVEITGSADYPSFQFYIVEFAPEPNGQPWQIIGTIHESPVINGVLETWDTTLIPDGSYTLRLRVVRLDGNYSEAFARQVVVSNAQPLPTDTPTVTPTAAQTQPQPGGPPTATSTPLPPTPTIIIEQPVVETPTPRPAATAPPLEDPDADNPSLIPTISGFSVLPLRDACLYGGGIMFSVFLFFGLLSALQRFIKGFIDRRRGL